MKVAEELLICVSLRVFSRFRNCICSNDNLWRLWSILCQSRSDPLDPVVPIVWAKQIRPRGMSSMQTTIL
jgi:hypothetical protein